MCVDLMDLILVRLRQTVTDDKATRLENQGIAYIFLPIA